MYKVSGHEVYFCVKGDIVEFCSDIRQIFREKGQDWVDVLPEVFGLVNNWGNIISQLVEILQIVSALGRTFLQEIYTKKRTWRSRSADAPLAQLQTCVFQSRSVSTEKLQHLYKNFYWDIIYRLQNLKKTRGQTLQFEASLKKN